MRLLRYFKRAATTALFVCGLSITSGQAQQVAIKTNLLYDAATTPNLGVEVGFKNKHSLQLFYGINAWKFDGGTRQAKHWVVMPEYRWWTCTTMNGWFIGVHAMGGEFNAGRVNLPIPGMFFSGDNLTKEVKTNRYEGKFVGGGFTAGYQWILGTHWNLELEAGVGYNYVWYDKFPCAECGSRLARSNTNYVGLTKLGLSLLYIF